MHAPIDLATGAIKCWRSKRDTVFVAIIAAGVEEFEDGVSEPAEGETYVQGIDENNMPVGLQEALVNTAPKKPAALLKVHAGDYMGQSMRVLWRPTGGVLPAQPDGPFSVSHLILSAEAGAVG